MTRSPRRPRKRLSAEERKQTILEAARQSFAENGDIGGTTTKMIAQRAGVSEAVLYRHFPSKEALYFDAVVEPLTEMIERTIAGIEEYPAGLTEQERVARVRSFNRAMLERMIEVLPSIGLVLFGDPDTATKFYERCWRPALDRLSNTWARHYESAGMTDYPDNDVAVRVTLGTCMMYALDAHYGKPVDRAEAARQLTEAGLRGVFTLEGW